MLGALKRHWPEYLMEGAGLALFMFVACGTGVLVFHPASPVMRWIEDVHVRRLLMGLTAAGSAAALIYSPWGKQSGAHFNPAVTLTFFRLGKVPAWDAVFYIVSQAVGGLAGVVVAAFVLGRWLAHPAVHYIATVPGQGGPLVAWLAEGAISFVAMSLVLAISNTRLLARFTGIFAAATIAINVSFVSPLAGTSTNPARTFASAVPSGIWAASWVYFTGAPLAMLLAAQAYLWWRGPTGVFCAKLHHQNDRRCIFCEARAMTESRIEDRSLQGDSPSRTKGLSPFT